MAIKPSMLNLPEKFDSYRLGQFEIAAKIAGSTKYAYMLDAPTGIGKSLIAATIQRLTEKNMTFVCATKQLQSQILNDFPYARTLKGRSNYRCEKFPRMWPRVTAEECSDKPNSPCINRGSCAYLVAKKAALSAPIAVLNAAYFLSEANFVGGFSGTEMLLYDEADTCENMLMSFIEVVITQKQLNELELEPPKFKTKFESWVEWGTTALRVLIPRLEQLKVYIESEDKSAWGTVDLDMLKQYKVLERLCKKLAFFVKQVNNTWVWYEGQDNWVFKPTWIAPYAAEYLWQHAKRTVLMSATILDYAQRSKDIGLDINNVGYSALTSPFPKENRPIYILPVANVVNKNMDQALPMLAKYINLIMEQEHPNDKGLIHCVSYRVMNYLKENIKQKDRLMTHTTANRTEVLDTFKMSPQPKVLLSPSMDRGVDLPDDQCRFIIIAKMPYGDLGDPQIQRRVYGSKDGNRWYALQTVSKIIQMSGRGVRNADDYCDTYILDDQFNRLFEQNDNMFPRWWRDAIIRR